jgi:hypothetical protein
MSAFYIDLDLVCAVIFRERIFLTPKLINQLLKLLKNKDFFGLKLIKLPCGEIISSTELFD